MPSVEVEELSLEAFRPFGNYVNLLNPDTEVIGTPPVEFYRDMAVLPISNPQSLPSFSVCRVEKRPLTIDVTEMHSFAAEGNLPLDADAIIHVAPATPNGILPLGRFRVFRIPKGTFFTVNAGVWHHAPFLYDKFARVLNLLVVLPERTYANDCTVVKLKKNEAIRIKGNL